MLFVRRLVFDDGNRHQADLWLINSCTVKSPSQSQMATVISDAKKAGKYVVVAGCVPQGSKTAKELQVRHDTLSLSLPSTQMENCHTHTHTHTQLERILYVVTHTARAQFVCFGSCERHRFPCRC